EGRRRGELGRAGSHWCLGRRRRPADGAWRGNAGTVLALGWGVDNVTTGDEVMTHPLPLRAGGAWAPLLIASAALLAPKPGRTSWEEAAAFPVPALTAEQVLSEALEL